VSVNGKLIPYNMKIGEAGEAFFVFETDADVPDDLITSPILEATRPGQKNVPAQVQAGKFGSKETEEYTSAQEPEYFDLDDTGPSANGSTSKDEDVTTPTEMRQGSTPPTDNYSSLSKVADAVRPSNFLDASMGLGKAVVHAVIETERENRERLQDRVSAARNVAGHMSEYASRRPTGTQQTGDEALPDVETKIPSPHVEYRGGQLLCLYICSRAAHRVQMS
jgi:phosphatidate phosphatase LPIN